MIRNLALITLGFILSFTASAQLPEGYFQQEVAYTIDVSLDDTLHLLSGACDIEYVNNSPDALSEIYLHLWPNAFRNRSTAFAQQMLENNDREFYFADKQKLGGYKDIDIKINESATEWNYHEGNFDIVLIKLVSPLQPGGKLTINTGFEMKIPDSFSRLGHVGQSYQMTQWYPKPAVYDLDGWHPMPYLDQGEFYSEFGSFDVSITLPDNYVVGATGVLQTETEKDFLEKKIIETRAKIKKKEFTNKEAVFPPSSTKGKTIRYTAENVHDFAWFADKRFYVNRDQVEVGGKKVDTYVMFTDKESNLWTDAINYVNRSVLFYSEQVGDYPYPQATAVQSALSAGAGMEYPMITVIGLSGSRKALDEVITHEVGHNWFYGILATNERDHAWMDEGFNTFYEGRYMKKNYEKTSSYLGMDRIAGVPDNEANQLTFLLPMRRHTDQPIDTKSQDLRLLNYWTNSYDKPAFLLRYLEAYLGTEVFDATMHKYYEVWKFKHPRPQDVKRLFETETGKDLSWFFGDLIGTTKRLDYAVKSLKEVDGKYELTVVNKGAIQAPFPVQSITEEKIQETMWFEGFEGEKTLTIPASGFDRLAIDYAKQSTDINKRNNSVSAKGGKMEPLQFKFLGGVEDPDRTTIYYTPIIAANAYDGFMVGLGLYNTALPSKRFEWAIAPMFATKSKDLAGIGNLKFHSYPSGGIQRITVGLGYKRFHHNENDFIQEEFGIENNLFSYQRIKPSLELEFKNKRARDNKKQTLEIAFHALQQEFTGDLTNRDTIITPTDTTVNVIYDGHDKDWSFIPTITYRLENTKTLHPYSLMARLEQQSYQKFGENAGYLKLSLEGKYKFRYKEKKALHLRAFVGYFLWNTERNAGNVSNYTVARGSFSMFGNGFSDYLYDDYFFARNAATGIGSQQIQHTGGGFKTPISSQFKIGQTNDFLAAINMKFDLPMELPDWMPAIRPYLDMGYFHDAQPTADGNTFADGLLVSGGVGLEFLDGDIGVYLPLFTSKREDDPNSLGNILEQRGGYLSRIGFTINLSRLDPFKFAYGFDL